MGPPVVPSDPIRTAPRDSPRVGRTHLAMWSHLRDTSPTDRRLLQRPFNRPIRPP
ncbi:hypothetical protein LINPERHAP1_LOCUS28197 [Linum perenne]